ncbi:RHS repeat-associated core domain-containing protein [Streptomyces sp. NPDC008121]|uniref:RHS repeat-associated core domain-containing protein n=1 Tax=Streptomyces sp. NPDC008121 TaxID=3364809 RepID=UPI0036EA6041
MADTDRFGHETAYQWELHGEQHRLVRVTDAYGQAVTFDYGTEGQVTVTSPVRSDGQQPVVVLRLDDGRLASVTDAAGQKTALAYGSIPAGMPGRLLTAVHAPAGAVTRIGYAEPHGFPVAASLKVTDGAGRNLTAERTFTLDVNGEHAGHDFTGRGQYASADELFDSADPDYRYATELSDGRSTVRSVFNSLHLLKERTALLNVQGDMQPVRTQQLRYEGERDGGQVPPAASDLPANYAKPVAVTVTVHDPATGTSRTATESAKFDVHGRQVERTGVTGATTVTAYDPPALHTPGGGGPAGYGLPLRTVVTGHDGAQAITENTLSADRRSVVSTTESVKNAGESKPSARTSTRFTVSTQGEVTQKTVAWAEGAEPEGAQGPDSITEIYASTIDTARHLRTDTVKNAAGASSQATDLVTGQVVRATDAEGRTVERSFDGAGRVIAERAPGGPDGKGLVTTTSYTPATTTVSTPGQDGRQHITVEERDLLGRVIRQTDNVRNGELTGDPAARTLQTVQFEDQGRTAKVTDQAGRTTVTTSDDLGRQVKAVAPNGMTELTAYADAAAGGTSTVTALTLPAGVSDPARAVSASTGTLDPAGRPVAAGTSFADGTRQSGTSHSYDSLGRVSESVSGDVAVTPSYGAAGAVESTVLTPKDTSTFPGGTVTAAMPKDLTGAPVVKTLAPGREAGAGRSGTALVRDEAGRVTEESRPDGKKTVFTYTPGGRLKESVSPGGIRTSYRYDGNTGQVLQITVTSADGKRTEKTGYTYDPHTGAVTSVFDPDDRAGTLIAYRYDADGHVTHAAYPDGTAVRQEFGDNGQLRKTTDAAGLTTFYAYSPDGTLAGAVQRASDDTDSPVKAQVAYTYDGLGRITKVDRGNGVITETGYTGAHQISREKTTKDGRPLSEAAYTYDSHNSLTQRTDTRPQPRADGTPGEPVTTTTRYTYDAYNRLTGSEVSSPGGRKLTTTAYTLNVAGDVVKTGVTPHTGVQAGKTTVTVHSIDSSGRLTAVTTDGRQHPQTFDTDGNLLTSHTGTSWTYSLHGQPVTQTTPDGTLTRYTYWADGTRATAQTTPAGSSGQEHLTRFHYTPDGTLLNDTHTTPAAGQDHDGDPGNTLTASYLLAGTRHARTLTGPGADQAAATGAGYLVTDRHGSTTALTATGSGETSQVWQYTDYGQHADHTGTPLTAGGRPPASPAGAARQPFTFAGEHTSPEGTQYLKTRTYDPATGRFTTADNAPQFNRYQAMGANPVNRIDPEGTTDIPDWGSYLIMGLTAAATIISTIATWGTTAPAMAIAIAGAVLDLASTALDTAATATGRTRIDDPLSIASLTLGALGAVLGIGSAAGALMKTRIAAPAATELENFASPARLSPQVLAEGAENAAGTKLVAQKTVITGEIQHDPPTGVHGTPAEAPAGGQSGTDETIGTMQQHERYERARTSLFSRIDRHYAQFRKITAVEQRLYKKAATKLRSMVQNRPLAGYQQEKAVMLRTRIEVLHASMAGYATALRYAALEYDAVSHHLAGRRILMDYRDMLQADLSDLASDDAVLVDAWLEANT